MKIRAILIAALCFTLPGVASAALVTFEESPQVSGATPTTQGNIVSGGYSFESSTSHTHFLNNFEGGDSGSTFLGSDDFAGATLLTMTQVGGDAFNLNSLDLGSWRTGQESTSLKLTGNLSGGGSISTTIALGAFSTFILGWSNLISVAFDSVAGSGDQYYGMDNINVSAVPVPAAVWLFGTALIGLVGFGKRKARTAA